MQITVIGLGYVGLTTALGLAEIGHTVTGIDTDKKRIETIATGNAPFYEPGMGDLLQTHLMSKRFVVVRDTVEAIRAAEVIFICVGTPITDGKIDLSMVKSATRTIGSALRDKSSYSVVVVKSTVIPGTTNDIVRDILLTYLDETRFGVCVNPEFLREGRAVQDFLQPDRIVIGQQDERAGLILHAAYNLFECPIIHTTLENAEMVKYASNAFVATLISFSNEIAALCEATPRADIQAVLEILHLDRRLSLRNDGLHIKPDILSYLWAGCGYGGSCLPKDTHALAAYGQSINVHMPLLRGVIEVNTSRPDVVVQMTQAELGDLRGRVITILGIAFKPGTDDIRESPALNVITQLMAQGAIVRAYDPMARLELSGVLICDNLLASLVNSEAAIICTAWGEFIDADWQSLSHAMNTPLIIDGRGILQSSNLPENVIYRCVGRIYSK